MTVTDSLYRQYVDERYRVLRQALVVSRSRPDWGLRLEQTRDLRAELRSLVRIRWFVRRQARHIEQQDAVTQAKSWHDWQAHGPVTSEDDLLHGYGVSDTGFDRESQPEFNGAFNRW